MSGFGYIPGKGRCKDLLARMTGHRNLVRRLQASTLLTYLSPKRGERVLDIGCGSGWFAREIAKHAGLVVGVDRRPWDGLSAGARPPALDFLMGDGGKMPFREGVFDKALLSSVLQVVSSPSHLLRECGRVLKRGGLLCLSVPVGYLILPRLQHSACRPRWLPATEGELRERLDELFHVEGPGYFTLPELARLLEEGGFRLEAWSYAPRILGSLLLEIWILLCLRRGGFFRQDVLFVFYPLALLLERTLLRGTRGNEIVALARRAEG